MSSKPLLIGLSGKAGAGKSTVGDYLAGAHGYAQFAFAGALKEVVQTAFHFTEAQMVLGKEAVDPRWGVSPRWCLQWLGTEVLRAKWPDIWIRHLRQEILDFLSINGQRPIVVTDVRFRDEAEALKAMGAVLVRIERKAPPSWELDGKPLGLSEARSMLDLASAMCKGKRVDNNKLPRLAAGATGMPGHVSEVDLDGWEGWDVGQGNHVIDNNGTMENLKWCIEAVLAIEADKAELAKAAC
jgi:dephospho-CoA kinase